MILVWALGLASWSGNTGNSGNTARKPAEILGFSVATWRKHQKTAVATLATDAKATPAGQIDGLKAWASVIRASASVALKQLDEMEGAV